MWTYVEETLHGNPVALLFAVLGLGYLVGKTRIKGFGRNSPPAMLRFAILVGLFVGMGRAYGVPA